MSDFLLEIGCEEVPARMIDAAEKELARRVGEFFKRHSLSHADPEVFSTPRRLAVLIGTAGRQPVLRSKVLGPSEKVAFKEGRPTKAAEAFAQREGIAIRDLQLTETEKGRYVYAETAKGGRDAIDVMVEHLSSELEHFYWPKAMYWKERSQTFVRPIRWIVAMLDDQIVPIEFRGVNAGNISRGHRILADKAVAIPKAGHEYVEALAAAKVLSRSEREKQIRKDLDAATRKVSGARWREDKSLLDTVVNLTEFPSAILGNFDAQFLELPEEVLVTVMRDHQKYFAVEDANGKLAPHFLAVLNTDGDRDGMIQHGNERVLRARFNDARFFWRTDQKQSLRDRLELLKHVTFQKDLGSYYDKTIRTQRLSSWLSETLKQAGVTVRPGVVHKAACLAKADLTTELVKEFTELQGIVGGLYARVQVLDESLNDEVRQCISTAIYDHYKPESMDDTVPRTVEGAVLSIADKADSIAGMFALGLVPSGSKDPFGLRRQANGIVKTIAEHKLPIQLTSLMEDARVRYRGSEAEKKFSASVDFDDVVRVFFRERLEFYLRDARGFAYDVVNAVLAVDADDVMDALARAEAVSKVRSSADFASISVAFKRMKNILRQASEAGREVAREVNPALLQEQAEKDLAAQVPVAAKKVEALRADRNYEQALLEIGKLRPAIDHFFDKVMVMAEDAKLRANRLALLQTLLKEFSTIADFSEIVTEGKESKESSKQ